MALTKWQPPVLRHAVDDEGDVSWLELFFDLIYVAALIQLGDALSDDVTWGGAGRFAGLFVVLWWTWTGTTAFVNRFATDDIGHRMLVFVQMFAVGNLALVAVAPIDDRWSWLVVAYVGARIPLLVMYLRARRLSDAARRLADLYLSAFGVGVGIWLASLLVPTPARFALWGVALVVEFVAPIVGVRRVDPPRTHTGHFGERYALFTIIVLGESFVKTLTELAGNGVSIETQVFGGLTFAITIAFWWTYFDDIAGSRIRRRVGRVGHDGSIRVVWTYAHLPLAMGLTAYGVGSKKIVGVEAFGDGLSTSYVWLVTGSIVTVLVAAAVIDVVTVSPHFAVQGLRRIAPGLVAAGAIVGWAAVAGSAPAVVFVSGVVTIVVAQIAVEVATATLADRSMDDRVGSIVTNRSGTCEHLDAADRAIAKVDRRSAVCEECERLGLAWVQLRVCAECATVGCCDDSDGRHARAHHDDSGHPVTASAEPGDTWAYCFSDDVVDDSWTVAT